MQINGGAKASNEANDNVPDANAAQANQLLASSAQQALAVPVSAFLAFFLCQAVTRIARPSHRPNGFSRCSSAATRWTEAA